MLVGFVCCQCALGAGWWVVSPSAFIGVSCFCILFLSTAGQQALICGGVCTGGCGGACLPGWFLVCTGCVRDFD